MILKENSGYNQTGKGAHKDAIHPNFADMRKQVILIDTSQQQLLPLSACQGISSEISQNNLSHNRVRQLVSQVSIIRAQSR